MFFSSTCAKKAEERTETPVVSCQRNMFVPARELQLTLGFSCSCLWHFSMLLGFYFGRCIEKWIWHFSSMHCRSYVSECRTAFVRAETNSWWCVYRKCIFLKRFSFFYNVAVCSVKLNWYWFSFAFHFNIYKCYCINMFYNSFTFILCSHFDKYKKYKVSQSCKWDWCHAINFMQHICLPLSSGGKYWPHKQHNWIASTFLISIIYLICRTLFPYEHEPSDLELTRDWLSLWGLMINVIYKSTWTVTWNW